jgi:hypothetical protein
MSTSSGAGFNCCKARQVRRKSSVRFLVVIITETVILTGRAAALIGWGSDQLRSL